MTLAKIKAMFSPGQKWHATRTGGGPHRDELRTVHRVESKNIIFQVPSGELYWTGWPKAAEVKEARPGFLRFGYSDGPEVTLKLQ